ncbi:hypothetical protein OROMI_008579 [Orobanche minor]
MSVVRLLCPSPVSAFSVLLFSSTELSASCLAFYH